MTSSRFDSAFDGTSVAPLAQPLTFTFSKKSAQNRLLKTSMAENLATFDPINLDKRGIPTEGLIEVFKRWAEGEWGVIHTGNIQIDLEHLGSAGDAVIPLDAPFSGERFEAFKKWAAAGKAHGSLMIAQVSHVGRQVEDKYVKEAISASAVQLEPQMGMTFAPVRAATKEDIEKVIQSFAHAAAFLEAAGWDGIELHGAHGYLLAQFLSQRTNHRADEYGGSLGNRMRLIKEISTAIRDRTSPSFILAAKLNSVEFQSGGFTPEEAAELCRVLQDEIGMDYIELSGGTYEAFGMEWKKESTREREAFFLEFAERVVPAMGPAAQRRTKVYLTGGFRTAGAMAAVLNTVDGVGVGRPAAQEPTLARDILSGKARATLKPVAPFDDNFGLSMMAAGAQIRQMSKGLGPFNMSDPKDVEQFSKDMNAWFQRLGEDTDGAVYGHVEFTVDTPRVSV